MFSFGRGMIFNLIFNDGFKDGIKNKRLQKIEAFVFLLHVEIIQLIFPF